MYLVNLIASQQLSSHHIYTLFKPSKKLGNLQPICIPNNVLSINYIELFSFKVASTAAMLTKKDPLINSIKMIPILHVYTL